MLVGIGSFGPFRLGDGITSRHPFLFLNLRPMKQTGYLFEKSDEGYNQNNF
jgi:hypothetical protein